jgi:hypothetical protein
MKLYHLTTFQLEVLSLADTGATASVSEVVQGLHGDDPLAWLQRRFQAPRFGRTIAHDPKIIAELNDALMRHANVLDSNDTGVANSGVLFLPAVINNIIAADKEWTR